MGTNNKENKNSNVSTIVLAIVAILVVIALIVGLVLTNKNNGNKVPSGKGEEATAEKTESQTTDFTKWVSDTIDGNYYIPNLLFESEDAKAINNEINTLCANRPTQEENPNYGIGYNTYYNKGILSIELVISNVKTSYTVFNFDVENQTRVSNKDLLERLGVSEENFITAVKDATESSFRAQFEVAEENDDYKAALDATLAEVKMEMPIFMNSQAALVSVVTVHHYGSEEISENQVPLDVNTLK